jgi:hypothetical protein
MSRYAWLICEESKQMIWLGKVITDSRSGENYFKIGDLNDLPNSQNAVLTKAMMKFLAVNVGRNLRVITDEEFESVTNEEFTEIGEDESLGIGFDEYLHGFQG